MRPMYARIYNKLREALSPVALIIKVHTALGLIPLFQLPTINIHLCNSNTSIFTRSSMRDANTGNTCFPLFTQYFNTCNAQDESHLHAGHSGNPSGSPDAETHFKVEIISDAFEGKGMVARHRLIYSALDQELKDGVHALSLKTKTSKEAPDGLAQ